MTKHQRDEWTHYRIRFQHKSYSQGPGRPWKNIRVWEVMRPWDQYDTRDEGDDWDKVAYTQFDSHDDAIRWATEQATKDRMLAAAHEWVDNNIDELIAMTRLVTQ